MADKLFWLSFCDATRPTGQQFLGGVIIQAPDTPTALERARTAGINPGGECLACILPSPDLPSWALPFLGRLLSKEEIKVFERAARTAEDADPTEYRKWQDIRLRCKEEFVCAEHNVRPS